MTLSFGAHFRVLGEPEAEKQSIAAIEERKKKDTSLCDSAIPYEIPRSTLSDRLRVIPIRHEAKQNARPFTSCQMIINSVDG